MRITAKTVPAGSTFLTRFPHFVETMDQVSTDGAFDEAKFRSALREWQDAGYVVWGDDDRRVLAFAAEFLHQLAAVTAAVEADPTTTAHTAAKSASDRRLVQRANQGRYAYTRFDITSRQNDIRVRVSCANPRDIPGTALASARRFACYASRILLYIERCLTESNPKVAITLEGVGEMADIFDEARWQDRRVVAKDAVDAANRKRQGCAKRVGEYCSPASPDCPCYHGGKCTEAELAEEFRTYKGPQP